VFPEEPHEENVADLIHRHQLVVKGLVAATGERFRARCPHLTYFSSAAAWDPEVVLRTHGGSEVRGQVGYSCGYKAVSVSMNLPVPATCLQANRRV
jgi:hypothetical protein